MIFNFLFFPGDSFLPGDSLYNMHPWLLSLMALLGGVMYNNDCPLLETEYWIFAPVQLAFSDAILVKWNLQV